jgi:hypothetical protein
MWRRIIGGVTISHQGNWYPILDLLNNNPQKCTITPPSQTLSNYMQDTIKSNVPVIVDAEPLKTQNDSAFYKTYHFKDQETLAELDKDIRNNSDINSFKLVQKTFLEQDTRLPWVHIEKVDDAFDCAVRLVIHSARRRPDIRLIVATHNKESIRKAIFEANMNLKNSDYEPSSKQVQFALAPGIGDAAEQIIVKHGYIIHR